MYKKTFPALGVAMLPCVLLAAAALAAGAPTVSVTVTANGKTLVKASKVHGEKGSITKGGTPKGKCPGASALGALDQATHGKWVGKYFSSVGGIEVTSIEGVAAKTPGYWELFVNGKSSNTGACGVKLKAGEKIAFKLVK